MAQRRFLTFPLNAFSRSCPFPDLWLLLLLLLSLPSPVIENFQLFLFCFKCVLLLKIIYNIGQEDVWTILTAHTREDNKNNHSVHSLN